MRGYESLTSCRLNTIGVIKWKQVFLGNENARVVTLLLWFNQLAATSFILNELVSDLLKTHVYIRPEKVSYILKLIVFFRSI